MRLFKRISSTVLASVDKVVSEVENHDAVVESMLSELRQASAESKIRLKRVQQDGKKMREQVQTLTENEKQWTERAKQLANNEGDDQEKQRNQNKALICLERRHECNEQIERLNDRLGQHALTEQKLSDQLKSIESKHSEISNKRHLLQSQQAIADANRVVIAVTGAGGVDINDALDRWEISIAKKEFANPNMEFVDDDTNLDAFAAEFVEQETKSELLAELEALKADDETSTNVTEG